MGFIQIWIELRQFRFSLRVEIVKFLFHLCVYVYDYDQCGVGNL